METGRVDQASIRLRPDLRHLIVVEIPLLVHAGETGSVEEERRVPKEGSRGTRSDGGPSLCSVLISRFQGTRCVLQIRPRVSRGRAG